MIKTTMIAIATAKRKKKRKKRSTKRKRRKKKSMRNLSLRKRMKMIVVIITKRSPVEIVEVERTGKGDPVIPNPSLARRRRREIVVEREGKEVKTKADMKDAKGMIRIRRTERKSTLLKNEGKRHQSRTTDMDVVWMSGERDAVLRRGGKDAVRMREGKDVVLMRERKVIVEEATEMIRKKFHDDHRTRSAIEMTTLMRTGDVAATTMLGTNEDETTLLSRTDDDVTTLSRTDDVTTMMIKDDTMKTTRIGGV